MAPSRFLRNVFRKPSISRVNLELNLKSRKLSIAGNCIDCDPSRRECNADTSERISHFTLLVETPLCYRKLSSSAICVSALRSAFATRIPLGVSPAMPELSTPTPFEISTPNGDAWALHTVYSNRLVSSRASLLRMEHLAMPSPRDRHVSDFSTSDFLIALPSKGGRVKRRGGRPSRQVTSRLLLRGTLTVREDRGNQFLSLNPASIERYFYLSGEKRCG